MLAVCRKKVQKIKEDELEPPKLFLSLFLLSVASISSFFLFLTRLKRRGGKEGKEGHDSTFQRLTDRSILIHQPGETPIAREREGEEGRQEEATTGARELGFHLRLEEERRRGDETKENGTVPYHGESQRKRERERAANAMNRNLRTQQIHLARIEKLERR